MSDLSVKYVLLKGAFKFPQTPLAFSDTFVDDINRNYKITPYPLAFVSDV